MTRQIPNPRFGEYGQPTFITVEDNGVPVEDPGCARVLVGATFIAGSPLFVPWLYPITTAIVACVAIVAREVADARMGIRQGPEQLLVMAVPAVVAFWICMRVDQRLGEWRLYRWPRHVLRVFVPAAVANLFARVEAGLTDDPSFGQALADTLHVPMVLTATVVAAALSQVGLFFGGYVRSDVHAVLSLLWLRSKKL